jgi:hypothetical protein
MMVLSQVLTPPLAFAQSFDGDQLLECIKELVRVDKEWIPQEHGYSLYIRPTAIATQPTLGVGPSAAAKMFVILSPVGPYYKTGFAPVSLLADNKHVRAWPGGVGQYKVRHYTGRAHFDARVTRVLHVRQRDCVFWRYNGASHVYCSKAARCACVQWVLRAALVRAFVSACVLCG